MRQCLFSGVKKGKLNERKLKFWEVYVDEGNLGKHISPRTSPTWGETSFLCLTGNFECREAHRDFRKLQLKRSPTTCLWH